MKKILFVVVAAMTFVSCIPSSVIHGSGSEAKGAFDIEPDYTALEVSSGIVVVLVDTLGLEGYITADEEVLEHVAIVRDGGRVKVSYEPAISVRSDIETVVAIPLSAALRELDVRSAARVTSGGRLLVSTMEVECSSAAEVDLDIDSQRISLDISSAARFTGNVVVENIEVELGSAARCDISGSAGLCEVESNSAANFRGYELVCRKVNAEASSSGSVEISVTEELHAEASSGGSVRYKGSPSITRRNQSSGGSVREVE